MLQNEKGDLSGKVFLRKSAVFFAERIFTITIEKTHGLQGRVFVRKINPTYNDRIIYHALGSCMVYLLVCYILLQTPYITLFTTPPPDHPLLTFQDKAALPKRQQ